MEGTGVFIDSGIILVNREGRYTNLMERLFLPGRPEKLFQIYDHDINSAIADIAANEAFVKEGHDLGLEVDYLADKLGVTYRRYSGLRFSEKVYLDESSVTGNYFITEEGVIAIIEGVPFEEVFNSHVSIPEGAHFSVNPDFVLSLDQINSIRQAYLEKGLWVGDLMAYLGPPATLEPRRKGFCSLVLTSSSKLDDELVYRRFGSLEEASVTLKKACSYLAQQTPQNL